MNVISIMMNFRNLKKKEHVKDITEKKCAKQPTGNQRIAFVFINDIVRVDPPSQASHSSAPVGGTSGP